MVSKFDDPPENCLSSKIAIIIVSLIWFTHFKYFFFKPLDIKRAHSSFSGLRVEALKLHHHFNIRSVNFIISFQATFITIAIVVKFYFARDIGEKYGIKQNHPVRIDLIFTRKRSCRFFSYKLSRLSS